MKNFVVMVFIISLAQSAVAEPIVSKISGPLTEADINLAITSRQKWFDRADLTCINQSMAGCAITLGILTPRSGEHPLCEIKTTDISSKSIYSLYCAVISTIKFPEQAEPTSFELHFRKSTMTPPTTTGMGLSISSQGTYAEAKIGLPESPPCKDLSSTRDSESIRTCFDNFSENFNTIYQRELHMNPSLSGTIKLSMLIEANGTASKITAKIEAGELRNAFIEKIISVIGNINFGKASENKEITHTMNFFPN